MTFLDVFEVPEHDEAIKNLVSVCLCPCVCVCVCVCVCLCVCVYKHVFSTFALYYRGRDGAKIFVILIPRVELLLSFRA
jgi:hypothetical protein